MIKFSKLDELSCLKNSEALIVKIEEVLPFMREKDFTVDISPNDLIIKDDMFNARLSIAFSFQPSLLHSPLFSELPSQQFPRKPLTFLDSFSNSTSS